MNLFKFVVLIGFFVNYNSSLDIVLFQRFKQLINSSKQSYEIINIPNKTLVSSDVSFLKQFNDSYNMNITKAKQQEKFKFLDLPPGGAMKVPNLKIKPSLEIFGYSSLIVSILQTGDFPIGIIKDIIWNQLSFIQVTIQSVRVEGGIIACLLVFLVAGVALPSAVLAQTTSCQLTSNSDNDISGDESRCRNIIFVVLLDILIILLPFGLIGMFLSNEYLTQAVRTSPEVTEAIFADLTTFVRNSHLQIRFVSTTAMDQAVDASISDLEDVEELLGRPIQRTLATDTGVDVALEALNDICIATADVTTEILTLRTESQTAREAAKIAQDRLKDLAKQIDVVKRQCILRDQIACDMIDTKGLEVQFQIDKLLSERKLSKLRHLGENNFTTSVETSRKIYQNIPIRVNEITATSRQEIITILRKHKEVLYKSVEALEEVSRDFALSINKANKQTDKMVEIIVELEQWRWLASLLSSLIILLIWILIICGIICAHCQRITKIFPIFLTVVVLICMFSIGLWLIASLSLLIGSNGELFICKPLYDEPNFHVLTDLLDNPGVLFKKGGLFSNILKGNESLDVSIKYLLSECQTNQPVFSTFQLNRIFNIDTLTNHLTWPKLHGHLSNITVNINDTKILQPNLQKHLQDLSQAARVNLTHYRLQLSGSVTVSDLNAFADHLERIAGQMTDLTTSARVETLAARTRKIQASHLQRLEKYRDEILYKLTALEVHLLPLQRQANQSLSHLKTIQYYLANQGFSISQKKTSEYVTRLEKYLERFREHVLNQLTYEVAPCQPLWDVFHVARTHLCSNILQPMVIISLLINSFWISTVWCLIILMFMTPLIILIMNYYRQQLANGFFERNFHDLFYSDQGPWTTPRSTSESVTSQEQGSWVTPRRSSEQFLIAPARRTPDPLISSVAIPVPPPPTSIPVSTSGLKRLIESHISGGPRLRPQHESLRMIEPISFRNYNITSPSPRGWL